MIALAASAFPWPSNYGPRWGDPGAAMLACHPAAAVPGEYLARVEARLPQRRARSHTCGGLDHQSSVTMRAFHPAQVRAGLVTEGRAKYGGLHSLRHFYASWCINRKADGGLELPLKVVQARLGHASIQMTADRYGHPRAPTTAPNWRLRRRSFWSRRSVRSSKTRRRGCQRLGGRIWLPGDGRS